MQTATHYLTKETRRYEFTPSGSVVTVRFWDSGWCRSERTRTLQQAREEYARLAKSGWQKW